MRNEKEAFTTYIDVVQKVTMTNLKNIIQSTKLENLKEKEFLLNMYDLPK